MNGSNTTDTTDRSAVGVIPVTPEMLRGDTIQVLLDLAHLSVRGRLVGWGIWQAMNELFRGSPEEFFNEVSKEQYGTVALGDGWSFSVRQQKGTRWDLALLTPQGQALKSTVWDLWEFAKRGPHAGEAPRQLYSAIKRVSRTLGVSPRHYFGPSALAAPLMRLAGIGDHYPDQEELGRPEIARHALYSGRMQAVRIGVTDGPVREYDLNSAYSWGLSQVPSLRGARFRHCNGWNPDWFSRYGGWALMRVSWHIPETSSHATPLFPFPVRVKPENGGGVEYPRRGTGWYWSPLVLEAYSHWGGCIQVEEALVLEEATGRPFDFLRTAYSAREQFIRGGMEDTILKWALSCVWGKLCQKPEANWRSNTRCLLWAGMATSLVNAELLRVCMMRPRSVWHIHVDSILMSGDRRHVDNVGEGLGQWRVRHLEGIEQYRVGVWRSRHPNSGMEVRKSQGIPPGVLDWEEAREEWNTFGTWGRVPVSWKEFQGFGSCEYPDWLSEKPVDLVMPLQPGRMINPRKVDRNARVNFQVWQPPDTVPDPAGPFDTEVDAEDVFGLGHNPARRQERFL